MAGYIHKFAIILLQNCQKYPHKISLLVLQSLRYSCNLSRLIIASPPLWMQKHTDLCAYNFAQTPDLWHQPRLTKVICTWSCRFCEINPILPTPGLTGHSMTGKQKYSSPSNCKKDVDQQTWILHPCVSYYISTTNQPPRQSSWPALASIFGSNPSVIIIFIIRTINNTLIKHHCNDQHHHHHHLTKNTVAINIIINFTIASPQTSPPTPLWSPHT